MKKRLTLVAGVAILLSGSPAAFGAQSRDNRAREAAQVETPAVWQVAVGEKRSTLKFAAPGSSATSFEFRCENKSEHVSFTSRTFDSTQVHHDARGEWSISIELSSGPWSRRENLRHFPDDLGVQQGADAWGGSALDDATLMSFSRTGKLSLRSEPPVDLSARTRSDTHAVSRFFSACMSAELRSLDILNAASDAQAALRRGDKRLVGVNGYALTVPGTDLPTDLVARRYGVRAIEGTSDNGEHDLNQAARVYATLYNQALLRRIAGPSRR